MRSKILFLDQFGTVGGGQQVLLETLGVVDPGKFEATVALNGPGNLKRLLRGGGTPVIDLPLGNYHSGHKTIGDIARFGPRTVFCSLFLASTIVKGHFELIFANGPRTFACAALAGRLTKRPVIWHLHNVLSSEAAAKGLSFLASWVSQIIVCSKSAAASLLKYRPSLQSKIRVIYNSVPDWRHTEHEWDTEAWRRSFGLDKGFVSFGILGRVTPFKGQVQFIEAARLVLQHSLKARFFVVGSPAPDCPEDQAYYDELRIQVENSTMRSQVLFIEHQDEIHRYYSLIDVVVLASQGEEASPRTIVEAMYLGKPVVAPSQEGVREILRDGDTGFLVETAEPRLLADRMLELLNEPGKRQILGTAAKEDVIARFSRGAFQREMRKALTDCFESQGKALGKQVDPVAVTER
jgi:glycosyltransferase involved in cell wall biosynthesis